MNKETKRAGREKGRKSGPQTDRILSKRTSTEDGTYVSYGDLIKGKREFLIIKNMVNEYQLYYNTLELEYTLWGFKNSLFFRKEYTKLGEARAEVSKIKTFFSKGQKDKEMRELPKERTKLYRITIGVHRVHKSAGFYRDVAHYKECNPFLPKNALLSRSRGKEDWIYEDTSSQD